MPGYSVDLTLKAKLLSQNPLGTLPISLATEMSLPTHSRALVPLPPGNIRVNSLGLLDWPTIVEGTACLEWSNRNRVQQGVQGRLVAQDSSVSYPVEGNIQIEVLVNGVVVLTKLTTSDIFSFTSSDLYNYANTLHGNVQFRITPINAAGPGTVRTTPSFDMLATGALVPPEWVLPPYVNYIQGLAMLDMNTFICPTSMHSADPSRIISITSSGITHFSGSETGVCGFADGDRITARYRDVIYAVRDSLGNIFCLDNENKIRKITPDGKASVFATFSGEASSADTRPLHSLTIDGSDNLYVFSNYLFSIMKVTPGGVISSLAGHQKLWNESGMKDGTGADALFQEYCSIASDAAGNIFVKEEIGGASGSEGSMRYCTASGVVTTITGALGRIRGQMAVVGSDVYFTIGSSLSGLPYGLYKCTPAGVTSPVLIGIAAISNIEHLAPDPGGFLAWAGYGPVVGKLSPDGVKTTVYSYPQPTP